MMRMTSLIEMVCSCCSNLENAADIEAINSAVSAVPKSLAKTMPMAYTSLVPEG